MVSSLNFLLLMSAILILINICWKWSKSLLIIINMEALAMLTMGSLFLEASTYFVLVFVFFCFAVSESLILLSAFYKSLRFSGTSFSNLILN